MHNWLDCDMAWRLGSSCTAGRHALEVKPCCVQMSEVVRLGGQHSDADGCGMLVWAQTDGSLWWPAEALDPLHLPPARSLPPAALAGQKFANMTSYTCLLHDHYVLLRTKARQLWSAHTPGRSLRSNANVSAI